MDNPFAYDRFVTGKNFIGRKKECAALGNMLDAGENVVLISPPKAGTMSALQQTLLGMKLSGKNFSTCNLNLLNVRSFASLLLKIGNAVIRSTATTAQEYRFLIENYLSGTHFVFDEERFSDFNEAISLNWDPDEKDLFFLLRLPGRIAAAQGIRLYMIIDEFQVISDLPEQNRILRSFKEVLGERRSTEAGCSFIITGSRYNALRTIFHRSPLFRNIICEFYFPPAEESEIADHIVKGLLLTGKVIEKDAAMKIAHLFECNLWYINHFTSICDAQTKGYVTNAGLSEALNTLISIHDVRFRNIISSLTQHQLSFLKAAIDGVGRFTSADVIKKYSLNSSANVARVKDALMKKEIITFDDGDNLRLLDPLFHYWLENIYFSNI